MNFFETGKARPSPITLHGWYPEPDQTYKFYSRYAMFTFAFVDRYSADWERRTGGIMARAGMTSLDAGLETSQALFKRRNAPH